MTRVYRYTRMSIVIPPNPGTKVEPMLPGKRIVTVIKHTTGSDPDRYDVLLEEEE